MIVQYLVGDLLVHNQMMLLVYRCLNVVAHLSSGRERHGPTVRIGKRYLLLAALVELV